MGIADYVARNFQGVDLAQVDQARRQNALGNLTLQRAQQQQSLMNDPNTTPEQFVRGGMTQEAAGLDQLKQQAGKFLGDNFAAIAQSAQPKHAAAMFVSSPQFQSAARAYGLDPSQYTVTEQDTDDSIRNESAQHVRALGGQVPVQLQTIGNLNDPTKGIYQRNPQTGALSQVTAPKDTSITPYQQAELDKGRQQLVTRPAPPEAGDGMVQDYSVDLSSGAQKPIGKPYVSANSDKAGLGGREGVYFNRVISAANESVAGLKNIAELPVGASTGFLGLGASPGTSAIGATASALKNTMAPQVVQDYNTMLAGMSRTLAAIEGAGLAPNGSLTHSMDSIQLREGDTEMTKLRKLAEMRQIIEKGIEPNLSNPRLPSEQKQFVSDLIGQVQNAIPYTQHDITELQRKQSTNPATTLQQLMGQKGLGQSQGGPAKIQSDADYNALPSGAQYIAPDGTTRTKR